jgi:hypothetical protein
MGIAIACFTMTKQKFIDVKMELVRMAEELCSKGKVYYSTMRKK